PVLVQDGKIVGTALFEATTKDPQLLRYKDHATGTQKSVRWDTVHALLGFDIKAAYESKRTEGPPPLPGTVAQAEIGQLDNKKPLSTQVTPGDRISFGPFHDVPLVGLGEAHEGDDRRETFRVAADDTTLSIMRMQAPRELPQAPGEYTFYRDQVGDIS